MTTEENLGLKIGWVCFHCWEFFPPTFAGQQTAMHHFGEYPTEDPACRINARQFRALQDRCRSYESEDTLLHREIAKLEAEHAVALRREEEKGYARGLADAKKHPETLGLIHGHNTSVVL